MSKQLTEDDIRRIVREELDRRPSQQIHWRGPMSNTGLGCGCLPGYCARVDTSAGRCPGR